MSQNLCMFRLFLDLVSYVSLNLIIGCPIFGSLGSFDDMLLSAYHICAPVISLTSWSPSLPFLRPRHLLPYGYFYAFSVSLSTYSWFLLTISKAHWSRWDRHSADRRAAESGRFVAFIAVFSTFPSQFHRFGNFQGRNGSNEGKTFS